MPNQVSGELHENQTKATIKQPSMNTRTMTNTSAPPTGTGGSLEDKQAHTARQESLGRQDQAKRSGMSRGEFQVGESFGNMRDENINQAKAEYDAMLEREVNDLRNAYEQAVTDGELSMAEAKRDFEKNKGEIEQDHYKNTEFTNLYGNQMGIQNSQQMMGLQQGDQSRASSMNNENRQVKQQRIADVKTRLDGIRNIKLNNITSATSMRDHSVAQATSQANAQYSQQMGQFQSDNFQAERQQGYTQDNMNLNDQHTRGQMDHGDGITRGQMGYQDEITQGQMGYQDELTKGQMAFQDVMEQNRMVLQGEIQRGLMTHEQGLRLETMAEEYKLDIGRMNHGQLLELERMDVHNEHTIGQMNLQFSFDTKLNSQQIAGQIAVVGASGAQERRNIQARTAGALHQMEVGFQKEFQAEQKKYDLQLQRDLRGVTKGTPEYRAIQGAYDRDLAGMKAELEMKGEVGITNYLKEITTTNSYDSIINSASAEGINPPDPSDKKYNVGSGGQTYGNNSIGNIGVNANNGQFESDMKNYRGLVTNDHYRDGMINKYNLLD